MGVQALQAVLDGISVGVIYALPAMSFTIVWAASRIVNLALLQALALGGVLGWWLSDLALPLPVMLVVPVVVAALFAVVSHYVAAKPLLRRGSLAPLIATLAFGSIVQGVLAARTGGALMSMPRVFPSGALRVGPLVMSYPSLVVTVVAAVMAIAAIVVIRYTSLGLAFRASATNTDVAASAGINVGYVQTSATAVAGAYAGMAGILIGFFFGSVSAFMGFGAGLKGLIAMLIGGAGSVGGAMLGSLLIGVMESEVSSFLGSAYRNLASFVVLLVFLMIKPGGLGSDLEGGGH